MHFGLFAVKRKVYFGARVSSSVVVLATAIIPTLHAQLQPSLPVGDDGAYANVSLTVETTLPARDAPGRGRPFLMPSTAVQ